MSRLVIVGGSAAGARAAHSAVRADFSGQIDVVSRDVAAPFYRPALSKQMLSGAWTLERAAQPMPDADSVRWHAGRTAVGLDVVERTVALDDGTRLEFDRLVLATGCRPRALPGVADAAEANSIGGITRLRDRLGGGGHAVVIGAGLIGSEVASVLCAMGARVTLVDPSHEPLARALGPWANEVCLARHRSSGVDLRLGVQVEGVERDSDGHMAVELSTGETITADEAVVSVGVVPDTRWLAGSGIPLMPDGGVVCDANLLVEQHEGIAAAGDIASWPSARFGRRTRVEHWITAIEQGAVAGRNVLATPSERTPFDGIPTFWTEQHGSLIHLVGSHDPDSEWTVVEGTRGEDGFVAAARSGHITGYLLVNAPQRIGHFRKLLQEEVPSTAVP